MFLRAWNSGGEADGPREGETQRLGRKHFLTCAHTAGKAFNSSLTMIMENCILFREVVTGRIIEDYRTTGLQTDGQMKSIFFPVHQQASFKNEF